MRRWRGSDGNDAGLTLVELLVVVIIIGILATIGISVYQAQRRHAYAAVVVSDLNSLALAETTLAVVAGSFVSCTAGTVADGQCGFAASGSGQALAGKGYVQSEASNYATDPSVVFVDTTGNALSPDATAGFCATAVSAAAERFTWNSPKGGMQPVGTACPAA